MIIDCEGLIMTKFEMTVALIVLLFANAITVSAGSLSDTEKSVIKLTIFTVLDNTGHFNYVKADVGWDDTVKIWYIPKNSDSDAAITTLGEIVGVYVGVLKTVPRASDLFIMIGTQDNVAGKMYCLRTWVPSGDMTTEEAGLLGLKVLGTFEAT